MGEEDARGSHAADSTVPVLPGGQIGVGNEPKMTPEQLAAVAGALGGRVGEPAVPAIKPA